jgi:hypothetical protein
MRSVYPPLMIVTSNMTRTHHDLGNLGGKHRPYMRSDMWRRKLEGVKDRQVIKHVNENWYTQFIMKMDCNFTHLVELMGRR